jgi:hypothetical protein
MKRLVLSAAMLVAGCGGAFAQIGMSGTVSPSYQLIISSGSGPTLTGSGTATTSLNLGTGIAFYGTSVTTSGVTQNNSGNTLGSSSGAGGSTLLSFPVTIEVDEANSLSSHFELDAALSAAAATGITVSMGSQATLGTTPLALETSASYGTPAVYTIGISYLTTVTQATTPLSQTISITYNPA